MLFYILTYKHEKYSILRGCKLKKKIKITNYDGTIIEVEVNINMYNFDKENYWQEDWRDRKSKQESSFEEMYSYYEKGGIPPELQEEPTELTYIRIFEYEELHKAINKLPDVQRRRIILRYFYNLTLQQIANIENVNKMSVKNSLDVAIKKLRKMSNDFSL